MKKLIPLLLALALLTACGADTPAPTAPVKVWDESSPVPVTVSLRELKGDAAEVYDFMESALGGTTLLLDYECENAAAIQVRVYALRDGAWELLNTPAGGAAPSSAGSFLLNLPNCIAEGYNLAFSDGSGQEWPGDGVKTDTVSYLWQFDGFVEAMTGENIPVAIQVYDGAPEPGDSDFTGIGGAGAFFNPESLNAYTAAYAVTVVIQSQDYTGYLNPDYM